METVTNNATGQTELKSDREREFEPVQIEFAPAEDINKKLVDITLKMQISASENMDANDTLKWFRENLAGNQELSGLAVYIRFMKQEAKYSKMHK